MGVYITLGTQIPTLKQGDYRNHQLTSREFVTMLREQATGRDRKLVDLLLLREDNALLLQILKNDGQAEELSHKNYVLGKEKLQFLVEATTLRLEAEADAVTEFQVLDYPRLPKKVYPTYMVDFVSRYLTEQRGGVCQPYFYADLLLMGYADYIQKRGNKFLRGWFKLEQDIAAIFATISADKHRLDRNRYLLGDSPLLQLLRSGDWREISFSPEAELAASMRKLAEEGNLAIREQKIDEYKWRLLDNVTFSDIFSIDAMLAYLLKLQILERWEKLDKVQGEANFRNIVASLNQDFKQEMHDFKKSLKNIAKAKRIRDNSEEE